MIYVFGQSVRMDSLLKHYCSCHWPSEQFLNYVCVRVFLELTLIWVFYDKRQIEHLSLQFVAYLITNMIDINCLKPEVDLNTI